MRSERSAEWRGWLAPAAAGLVARLALIAWTSPLRPSLDEQRLWDLASSRMAGTAFLPPLYPLFLAALRALVGDGVTAVRFASACLSVVSILLVGLLAERHLGPGSGRAPAWAAALVPTLVYFDGRLRSESLAILLLLGFAVLWTSPRAADRVPSLAAGALLGLAALIRPELLVLPIVLILIPLRRGVTWAVVRRGLLLIPGILILTVPWAIRNHRVVGSWIISSNVGYNFWKSFNAQSDGSQIPVTDLSIWDDVPEDRMDAVGFEHGWDYVVDHPVRSLLLIPAKWGHLFGPERDVLSDVRQRAYPRRLFAADLLFALTQNVCWAALLAGGLFALLGPWRSEVKNVVLAVLATLLIVHSVFFGDDRFHVPLIPFLCVALPEAWDGSLRPRLAVRVLMIALALEGLFWIFLLARDTTRIATLWGG